MGCFLTPDERLELSNEEIESDPDWDWEDQYYFILGPHFGWSWKDFLNVPVLRMIRWFGKLNERIGSADEPISIRESEVHKAILKSFGGFHKSE